MAPRLSCVQQRRIGGCHRSLLSFLPAFAPAEAARDTGTESGNRDSCATDPAFGNLAAASLCLTSPHDASAPLLLLLLPLLSLLLRPTVEASAGGKSVDDGARGRAGTDCGRQATESVVGLFRYISRVAAKQRPRLVREKERRGNPAAARYARKWKQKEHLRESWYFRDSPNDCDYDPNLFPGFSRRFRHTLKRKNQSYDAKIDEKMSVLAGIFKPRRPELEKRPDPLLALFLGEPDMKAWFSKKIWKTVAASAMEELDDLPRGAFELDEHPRMGQSIGTSNSNISGNICGFVRFSRSLCGSLVDSFSDPEDDKIEVECPSTSDRHTLFATLA
ncbi:hypothetical protein BDY21DRAFT_420767 [Lineolata rhizophorae]|uniref:Uncharacterized protein n=1 Tax=Lineolata rhizophorae TaxID=578093 RepID=A0A6A6P4T1_9PEZI|nr:hypothetical protein BDY21DRAFT_420767 [Lineolata rhizophorae]